MKSFKSIALSGVCVLLCLSDSISATKVLNSQNVESMMSIHKRQVPQDVPPMEHRRLPGFFEELDLSGRFDALISTPIEDWETGQWVFAAILVLFVVWCCGCIGCARQRRQSRQYGAQGYGGYKGYPGAAAPYGGGGYGPGGYGMQQPMTSKSSGCCSCIRNLLLCFCCYELFCADCRDVPCFHHSSWSGNAGHDSYALQPGVEMV